MKKVTFLLYDHSIQKLHMSQAWIPNRPRADEIEVAGQSAKQHFKRRFPQDCDDSAMEAFLDKRGLDGNLSVIGAIQALPNGDIIWIEGEERRGAARG